MAEKKEVEKVEKKEVQTPEGVERMETRRHYIPKTDIYETDTDVVLTVDMPGVAKGDVDVMLEGNVLSIHGHVADNSPEEFSLIYAEYEVGDYERSFTVSDEVDREAIAATVKNGVLTLNLPKSGPETKRIAVSG